MDENYFIEKFQLMPNAELEQIAKNFESFVFEARFAAVTILKSRKVNCSIIIEIEEEAKEQRDYEQQLKAEQCRKRENLILELKEISIRKTRKYRLRNGNELKVKRIKENEYRIRIISSRGFLVPNTILHLNKDSTFKYYPFFYFYNFLIVAVGGMVAILFLALQDQIELTFQNIVFPLAFWLGTQILFAPLAYFSIRVLKKELGKDKYRN